MWRQKYLDFYQRLILIDVENSKVTFWFIAARFTINFDIKAEILSNV